MSRFRELNWMRLSAGVAIFAFVVWSGFLLGRTVSYAEPDFSEKCKEVEVSLVARTLPGHVSSDMDLIESLFYAEHCFGRV